MLEIVEGWTEAIKYKLESDGQPQPLDGVTVSLQCYSRDGTAKILLGSVAVLDPVAGLVAFYPDATDLNAINSPLLIRWKVRENTTGKVAYFPSAKPEQWIIHKP